MSNNNIVFNTLCPPVGGVYDVTPVSGSHRERWDTVRGSSGRVRIEGGVRVRSTCDSMVSITSVCRGPGKDNGVVVRKGCEQVTGG